MKVKKAIKRIIKKNKIKPRIPFSQTVYVPRWRLKNYYAVKEFGESHRRWFIEQRYMYELKCFPDLDNPKLFNEKIHWLNLYYHNPLITMCCDKYELKNYVKKIVGEHYIVPNIAIYEKANEINFSKLPDKFAIKVNWGDGKDFSEIITNKAKANQDLIKTKMNNAIRPWNNLYYSHFFWGYKNVVPKIIVEEYLDSSKKSLDDFKVHCFNGKAEIILVCEEREKIRMKKTFFDRDWNLMDCRRKDADLNADYPKPDNLSEMISVAEKLAEPFPFVRVDFYNIDNHLYVGEMTFHPGCGWEEFQPAEWNRKMGDMLVLPKDKWIEPGLQ